APLLRSDRLSHSLTAHSFASGPSAFVGCTGQRFELGRCAAANNSSSSESPASGEMNFVTIHTCAASSTIDSPAHLSSSLADSWYPEHSPGTPQYPPPPECHRPESSTLRWTAWPLFVYHTLLTKLPSHSIPQSFIRIVVPIQGLGLAVRPRNVFRYQCRSQPHPDELFLN